VSAAAGELQSVALQALARSALVFTPDEETAIAHLIAEAPSSRSYYPATTVSHIHPGGGEAYDSCGEFLGWQDTLSGCASERFPRFRSCDRKECPVCWKRWLRKEAPAASGKLWGKLRALDDYGRGRYGQLHHFQFSPPPEVVADFRETGERAALDRWLRRALPVAGIRAAAVLFHPFRQVGGSRGDSPLPPEELWIQQNGRLWYEAPHFHVLGCGFFRCEKDEDRPAVLQGAVISTLSRNLDEEATRRALFYLLDHSGVPVDGHRELAVRYYGDFHSSRVRALLVDTTREQKLCTCCEEGVYFFAGDENPETGERWLVPDCEPVEVVEVTKTYQYEVVPRARIHHPQKRLAVGLSGRPPERAKTL